MANQKIKILIVAAILLVLAFIVPYSGSFVILLATRAMAFAILAMSVDLLLGYTGMSSM
jgi:branched-chain amino acid transport system permease protein